MRGAAVPGADSASGILEKGLLSILPFFADAGAAVAICKTCQSSVIRSALIGREHAFQPGQV